MIRETALPFQLGLTEETMTPYAGLALFGEFLASLQIGTALEEAFPAPGSRRGYGAWEYLQPLLLLLHAGGRHLEDLEKIRRDSGLLRLLGIRRVPSTDAVGDWLRRKGLGGVEALSRHHRRFLRKVLGHEGRSEYTLDIDATGIEAEKESALRTYKGYCGYFPMVGHLAENGMVVGWEFREGNVPPAQDNLAFYKTCRKMMPAGKRIRFFRADAASYQKDLLDELSDDGVEYAVGGHLDAAVLEAIGAIPPERWRKYRGGWIAETAHTMNRMRTAFRLVVFRRPAQGTLFESGPAPEDRYHVVASNREESAEATMAWYDLRGEHSENRIKELKIGFAMEQMPCGQFHANALYFAIGVLAYNLFKLFSRRVLPPALLRKQVQGVRFALYEVAGKVVSSGRRLWLKVGEPWLDLFAEVRTAVAGMGYG